MYIQLATNYLQYAQHQNTCTRRLRPILNRYVRWNSNKNNHNYLHAILPRDFYRNISRFLSMACSLMTLLSETNSLHSVYV